MSNSARFQTFLFAACCSFALYSAAEAVWDSHGDLSIILFIVPSLTLIGLLHHTLRSVEKAVAAKRSVDTYDLKLKVWGIALFLNLFFTARVTSVLQSRIMMGIMWGLSAVTSWHGFFLLQLRARIDKPWRPRHNLFFRLLQIVSFAFIFVPSFHRLNTTLFVAYSQVILGLLYLTSVLLTRPSVNNYVVIRIRSGRFRITMSIVTMLLNVIFGFLCQIPPSLDPYTAAEQALPAINRDPSSIHLPVPFIYRSPGQSSTLYSSFSATSDFNGSLAVVCVVFAFNLSILCLALLIRQYERPVEVYSIFRKYGLKIAAFVVVVLLSVTFCYLCSLGIPVNDGIEEAPIKAFAPPKNSKYYLYASVQPILF